MSSHAVSKRSLAFVTVIFLVFFTGSLLLSSTASGQQLYVRSDSTASNPDGRSWATAFSDLQTAVNVVGTSGIGEIWVARGSYTSDGTAVLIMKAGVFIYGGFSGTESSRDARDWEKHVTIIDGEYERRCVVGANNACLDGFTLTRGITRSKEESGGGMYNKAASPVVRNCIFTDNIAFVYGGGMFNENNSSPELTNCRFTFNSLSSASGRGGGMYNKNSSPLLTDCSFIENVAANGAGIYNLDNSSPVFTHCVFKDNNSAVPSGGGGGMYNYKNSSPVLTHCSFAGNTSWYGGGIYNYESSSPLVTNCIFAGNTAESYGGGMYNLRDCLPEIVNCTFTVNTADSGGGMYNNGSTPELMNCSFMGNSASGKGGALYNLNCSPVVTNSIFWGDGPDEILNHGQSEPLIQYSCIQGGYEGEGNIEENPQFMHAPFTLQLSPGSPCMDEGTAAGAPEKDILGRSRPQGAGVDMGAYEGHFDPAKAYTLTIHWEPETLGETAPSEGATVFSRGERIFLSAYGKNFGYFTHWTGDLSGDNSTALLFMEEDIEATAHFTKDIYYVNGANTFPEPDGLSWATAYRDLQSVVDAASSVNGGEVWVAQGTYTGAEASVLEMKTWVALYGGFVGTESDREERDWEANATVIDGQGERRCVLTADDTLLDGFTITRGLAFKGNGGGMYNTADSVVVANCIFTDNSATYGSLSGGGGGGMYNGNYASPVVTNCSFTGNSADSGGAGMSNAYNASPRLTDCTFTDNSTRRGGGMYNGQSSSPVVTNCSFINNKSIGAQEGGGGMYNTSESSPTLTNCRFLGNSAGEYGGGMYNIHDSAPSLTNCIFTDNRASYGAGLFNDRASSPTLVNCRFTGNSAGRYGGGLFNRYSSLPALTNCSFAGNSADTRGGGMYNEKSSSPEVTNTIFWDNGPEEIFNADADSVPMIRYSCILDGYEGDGNIDKNPWFVNAPSDLELSGRSPCIDTGTFDGAPATDILGRPRPHGSGIDMGAYEFMGTVIIEGEEVVEGEVVVEGESVVIEGETVVEGELVVIEGETVVEGELVVIEGESVVEGEPVAIEGEIIIEGEPVVIEGEEEPAPPSKGGFNCSGSKVLDGNALSDWLLMGISFLVLASFAAFGRTKRD